MSAAKKKKKIAIARYVASIHLGQITRLVDDRVSPGQALRLTIKTGLESEKFTMTYRPLQDMRQREVRLLIFDPEEDTVHCTLYADFKRDGNVAQHELVLGYLHFRTSELPDPSENSRVERSFTLVQYNGTVSGTLTLLIRLQHRGAAVDDWVELGMGAKTTRVPSHVRGMFSGVSNRDVGLQGSDAPDDLMHPQGSTLSRARVEGDLGGQGAFQAHNPLNAATRTTDSDSKSSTRPAHLVKDSCDSDSGRPLLVASRPGGGSSVSVVDVDSDGSSRAAMLAGAAGGSFANTRRGREAAAAALTSGSAAAARPTEKPPSGDGALARGNPLTRASPPRDTGTPSGSS
jgi:hypothetical protein